MRLFSVKYNLSEKPTAKIRYCFWKIFLFAMHLSFNFVFNIVELNIPWKMMKVALFIPCYINAVYPQVGIASYKLLKSLGVDIDYPIDQTCCGQPMANARV